MAGVGVTIRVNRVNHEVGELGVWPQKKHACWMHDRCDTVGLTRHVMAKRELCALLCGRATVYAYSRSEVKWYRRIGGDPGRLLLSSIID